LWEGRKISPDSLRKEGGGGGGLVPQDTAIDKIAEGPQKGGERWELMKLKQKEKIISVGALWRRKGGHTMARLVAKLFSAI